MESPILKEATTDEEADYRMARFHRIITITQGGILYSDIAEIVRWIDFLECLQNRDYYLAPGHADGSVRCVGWHSYYGAQLPYVEFFMVPLLRLEFAGADDLYDLLRTMYENGDWITCDLDGG